MSAPLPEWLIAEGLARETEPGVDRYEGLYWAVRGALGAIDAEASTSGEDAEYQQGLWLAAKWVQGVIETERRNSIEDGPSGEAARALGQLEAYRDEIVSLRGERDAATAQLESFRAVGLSVEQLRQEAKDLQDEVYTHTRYLSGVREAAGSLPIVKAAYPERPPGWRRWSPEDVGQAIDQAKARRPGATPAETDETPTSIGDGTADPPSLSPDSFRPVECSRCGGLGLGPRDARGEQTICPDCDGHGSPPIEDAIGALHEPTLIEASTSIEKDRASLFDAIKTLIEQADADGQPPPDTIVVPATPENLAAAAMIDALNEEHGKAREDQLKRNAWQDIARRCDELHGSDKRSALVPSEELSAINSVADDLAGMDISAAKTTCQIAWQPKVSKYDLSREDSFTDGFFDGRLWALARLLRLIPAERRDEAGRLLGIRSPKPTSAEQLRAVFDRLEDASKGTGDPQDGGS